MNPHHRRSIRLKDFDYTGEGSYFVTIAAFHREPMFGEIVGGEMALNDFGEIVKEEWLKSAQMRHEIELVEDEFVVMPNHFHGIVNIVDRGDPPVDSTNIPHKGDPPVNLVGAYGHTPYGNHCDHRHERWGRWFAVSNPRLPHELIPCAAPPARPSGSVITMNM